MQGAPWCTWWEGAGLTWSTTPPACTGLPGRWNCLCTLATGVTTTAMVAGLCRVEEGQGAAGPAISTAGMPTVEMACGVDPGTSVLKGSNVLANWAMDIGGAVSGGTGDKAGEVEDVLGAIAGRGGWWQGRRRCCKHPGQMATGIAQAPVPTVVNGN